MLFHLPFTHSQSDHYSSSRCKRRRIFRVISLQLNEWSSDRKLVNSRIKSIQNCIIYIYSILWYNHNSNTWLEPKFWVDHNEPLQYDKPGQRTTGLCPVWVTTRPRWRSSVHWTGLEPSRTVYAVHTRTAGGLPGPVANTSHTSHQTVVKSYHHNHGEFLPVVRPRESQQFKMLRPRHISLGFRKWGPQVENEQDPNRQV